jgi:hypothetical protein
MRLNKALRALLDATNGHEGARRVLRMLDRRTSPPRRMRVYWTIPAGEPVPSGAELVGTLEEVRRAAGITQEEQT